MLGIIIVHYKKKALTDSLIKSIFQNRASRFKTIIVDVSDNPDERYHCGNLVYIVRAMNRGYAYAVNRGVEKALKLECNEFVVLNNDVEVEKHFVTSIQRSLQKHPKAIIGGKIYYFPGFEYHKGRYKKHELGRVFWYAGGFIDFENAIIKHRGVDEVDRKQYETEEKTEFVSGCCIAFDIYVWKIVGSWNEAYFMYYEDADWCVRAVKRGIDLWYDPSIIIYHKNAQSTGGSGSNLHIEWQKKSRLRFALKYCSLRTKFHILKNYIFC